MSERAVDKLPGRTRFRNLLLKVEETLGLDTRMLAMVAALLIIWIMFSLLTGGIFLTPRNLYNLAVQSTVVGVLATALSASIFCSVTAG